MEATTETPRVQHYVLNNIKDCIRFWNNNGQGVYDDNRSPTGKMGDEETKAYALKTEFDDWMLQMVSGDCKTFVKSGNNQQDELKFETGRVRSHVWVHVDDDRKMMIYFDKSKQILTFE
tara:strand:+ start:815 stop:1171 length:357 start_codon:yes stop_codon:yes gene_type:complete